MQFRRFSDRQYKQYIYIYSLTLLGFVFFFSCTNHSKPWFFVKVVERQSPRDHDFPEDNSFAQDCRRRRRRVSLESHSRLMMSSLPRVNKIIMTIYRMTLFSFRSITKKKKGLKFRIFKTET